MRQRFENFKNLPFEERLAILVFVLVLFSFVGCTASSISEVLSLRPPQRFAKELKILKTGPLEEPKPPVHPLTMLPEFIEGFNTNARQKMPGAEGYIAEAIYQPDDKDIITRTPLNTYVSITYHSSKEEAEKAVTMSVDKQYPLDKGSLEIDGITALSGFDATRSSFYIGWTKGNYSVEFFTSFTMKIPPNSESLLSEYGKKVSIAVNKEVKKH